MKQMSMFSEELRLDRLSKMGDPLVRIARAINFEIFRPLLEAILHKEAAAPGGRPAFDFVMMFKILLLQQWYAMADDKTEFVINDRLSFQRFLGLSLGDKVPDAKTIWLFRENLIKSGRYKELFDLFAQEMETQGIITRMGSIVDASFVDAPRQRNTRDENKQIKDGKGKDLWKDEVHKERQKDKDARWTKKDQEVHYGYKDHVKVDSESKMIVDYDVSDASTHDNKAIVKLIDEKDKVIYADSAYVGEDLHEEILEKNPEISIQIHEKGYRNKPLTNEQRAKNREKSKVRARVEHVFGHMTNTYGDMFLRSIGIDRAKCQIGLKNLAYNLQRYESLVRLNRTPIPEQG